MPIDYINPNILENIDVSTFDSIENIDQDKFINLLLLLNLLKTGNIQKTSTSQPKAISNTKLSFYLPYVIQKALIRMKKNLK